MSFLCVFSCKIVFVCINTTIDTFLGEARHKKAIKVLKYHIVTVFGNCFTFYLQSWVDTDMFDVSKYFICFHFYSIIEIQFKCSVIGRERNVIFYFEDYALCIIITSYIKVKKCLSQAIGKIFNVRGDFLSTLMKSFFFSVQSWC